MIFKYLCVVIRPTWPDGLPDYLLSEYDYWSTQVISHRIMGLLFLFPNHDFYINDIAFGIEPDGGYLYLFYRCSKCEMDCGLILNKNWQDKTFDYDQYLSCEEYSIKEIIE